MTGLFGDIIIKDNPVSAGEVKNFTVHLCNRRDISSFIFRWHYSHNIKGLNSKYCFRLNDVNGKLIGAMIYGQLAIANVWKAYANSNKEIIELRRLCCIDNTPKNTESYFIGKTLKWLKKNTTLKCVISYADSNYGHEGTIYKASNFKYLGTTKTGKVIVDGERKYHDKSIRNYGTDGELSEYAKQLQKRIDTGEAKYINTGVKNIYLYQLRK